MRLLINIDHIATLRNARGEGVPDPVRAARVSEDAGAAGIVFHLREDRRHIKDEDVYRLKKEVRGLLDFEMAATDEMLRICKEVDPHLATLVPESRQELTTEGGLNMKKVFEDYKNRVIPPLQDQGIELSLFIDPNPEDVELCHKLGVEAIELHTGNFANAPDEKAAYTELERLKIAAELAHSHGLKVNAGHGLNFDNIHKFLTAVPHLHDISIGHAIVSEAVFEGLENTVRRMNDIIAGSD